MSDEMEYKTENLYLRFNIFYEKILDDSLGMFTSASVKSISMQSIEFYAQEQLEKGAVLKITVKVSKNNNVSFKTEVSKVVYSNKKGANYLVKAEMKNIGEKTKNKMEEFLKRINIKNVLGSINLKNIMDIHLVVGYPPIVKKSGKLFQSESEPFDEFVLRILLLSMLDNNKYTKFLKNKELNFVLPIAEDVRFRVNLHMQQGKIEGVFRIIPSLVDSPTLLGLPKVVEKVLSNQKGLIMVAGRTGSGKTTTVAAMVEFLNNIRKNIVVSIEEPIEYKHVNQKSIIKQREVGKDTLSFYNAAKNALRQNPDVLVIGEILDRETMETAITAAETGTLVLTTIHAGNVSQSLDRVSSFFPAGLQGHILSRLSLILKGVIAQELLPRLDEEGLALATEVMLTNTAIRRVIREADWRQVSSLIQLNSKQGMQTMHSSLEKLVNEGIINEEYLEGDS